MDTTEEVLKKHEREFQAGEVIYREGERAVAFYYLLSGSVNVTARVPNDGDILISILLLGEMVGVSEVFGEGRYHSTAIAFTKTRVIIFDAAMLELAWNHHPALMRRIACLNGAFTARLVCRLVDERVHKKEEIEMLVEEAEETKRRLEKRVGKEEANVAIAELLLELDQRLREDGQVV